MTSSWSPRRSVRRAAALVGVAAAAVTMSACIPAPAAPPLPVTALPVDPGPPATDPATTLAPTTTDAPTTTVAPTTTTTLDPTTTTSSTSTSTTTTTSPASTTTTTTVPNGGLTAAMLIDPATPQAGFNVSFGAQNSTDSTGTLTGFAWDFGDPSSASNTSTHAIDGHVYDQPGTYDVTLTIFDNHGATKSTTTSLVVAAAPVLVPRITISPANPHVGQSVTFSAAGSTDSAGAITGYVWSIPGTPGPITTSSATVTFTSTGYKLPVLTVTDDHGHTAQNTATLWVTP